MNLEDEIDKILKESMEITQAERMRAAEYDKLSYGEKCARKRGFANCKEYQEQRIQLRGFANRAEYQNWLAQKNGFTNNIEYKNYQAQQKGFANYAEYHQDCRFKNGTGSGFTMAKSKNSPQYFGEYIAERLLPKIFKEPRMMPRGNRGYDAICKSGYKIDVKSSVLRKDNRWTFQIRQNKTTDAFLCIAFSGSRDDLTVEHIWIIPGNETVRTCPLNEMKGLTIYDTKHYLSHVAKYELIDKVDDANNICMLFKQGVLK